MSNGYDDKKIENKDKTDELIVNVKLLGGSWVDIKKSKLVGCCHNQIHPGKLTKDIMTNHGCIDKECSFFEKYEDASYWKMLEAKKARKQKIKQKIKKEKEQEAAKKQFLEMIKIKLQKEADDADYKMLICRLEWKSAYTIKILYVSENNWLDAGCFPKVYALAKSLMPKYKFYFRRMKDLEGHLITIEEYLEIRKKSG